MTQSWPSCKDYPLTTTKVSVYQQKLRRTIFTLSLIYHCSFSPRHQVVVSWPVSTIVSGLHPLHCILTSINYCSKGLEMTPSRSKVRLSNSLLVIVEMETRVAVTRIHPWSLALRFITAPTMFACQYQPFHS